MRKIAIIVALLILTLPALAQNQDLMRGQFITHCARGCSKEAEKKGQPELVSACKPLCTCWIDDLGGKYSMEQISRALMAAEAGRPNTTFEEASESTMNQCAARVMKDFESEEKMSDPAVPAPIAKPATPPKKGPPAVPAKPTPKPGGSLFRAQ